MRPRAEKLWNFLTQNATSGLPWYGTYATLSEATQMSKKEAANAIKDLVNAGLLKKVNHGRAGIELSPVENHSKATGNQINHCGWCGAPVEHPEYSYCTKCGQRLRP